jgi:hypothetical protein
MLARVGRLLHRRRRLPFNHESVKIFGKQGDNCLRKRPHNLGFQIQAIENGQRPILKDRIGVENEHPGFHGFEMS